MKIHVQITAIVFAGSLTSVTLLAADPPELTTLRLGHEKSILQVQQEAERKVYDLDTNYVAALDVLLQKMTQASSLDGALAVRDEKNRVLTEIGLPAPEAQNQPDWALRNYRVTLYNFGVAIGHAWIHSSIADQAAIAQDDIRQAQEYLNTLAAKKFLSSRNIQDTVRENATLRDGLAELSSNLAKDIKKHSGEADAIYRLGLQLAVAETQTTSPAWGQAAVYVRSALETARTIVTEELRRTSLSREPIDNALRVLDGSHRDQNEPLPKNWTGC